MADRFRIWIVRRLLGVAWGILPHWHPADQGIFDAVLAIHAGVPPVSQASDGISNKPGDSLSPSHPEFTQPRPPIMRLCTLKWTCDAWPDRGAGVWQIEGYERLGQHGELILLRRVMPAEDGGSTGERIKVYRGTYEGGGLSVWRGGPDLLDPKYVGSAVPSGVNLPDGAKR